ncbi:N-acetylmuramoyl-L-alanine amidase [Amorphus orientalis]|uniref:N-acetylmuramoyl-L-alanine amidase n=1 Tax=Amorphus orientalis TaxID=649198 RepID=A0AAE4ASN5_9HYPH|nr:N-acetylmuramoyl-L-alanine amidase [Amorphus orientalis]
MTDPTDTIEKGIGRDPEAEWRPSPNIDRRGDTAPSLVILHYTGMPSADGALSWLCDPASKVSSHYFVFEDGRLIQSVDETMRAWHAGVSGWHAIRDVNAASIGIEIANPGHDHGYVDFPDAQILTVIALVRRIMARWQIPAEGVLAHSDVAPNRKIDPGERFPWARLADAGIGRYVPPVPIADGPVLALGDIGQPVARLQRNLASLGYPVEETASFDDYTQAVVAAFQRHFRPERVDGRADRSTIATLERLISE